MFVPIGPHPLPRTKSAGFTASGELKPIHVASHAIFVLRETDKPAGHVRFHSRQTHPRNLTASLSPRYSLRSWIPNGYRRQSVSVFSRYIRSWGQCSIILTFGQRRFVWLFRLASVDRLILGADFLAANNLIVDVVRRQLLDAAFSPPLPVVAAVLDPTATTPTFSNYGEFSKVLQEFPKLVCSDGKGTPHHGIQHHIITSGPPVYAKARRLDANKLKAAKTEFVAMEKAGIVRRFDSPWANPLHMVPKSDGSWRPCGDYGRLNLVTTPDRYPVPNVQDLASQLTGCTIFSKLDLTKGYYQVPKAPEDEPKTAVVTPFGLFEFLRMPFGLRNAGQTFQQLMDHICAGLHFAFVYLDDVLIASPDLATHIRLVLQRFEKHGLLKSFKNASSASLKSHFWATK